MFRGDESVIVRGFDYGTHPLRIIDHMSYAGRIESVDPVRDDYDNIDRGQVCVTFSRGEEAQMACRALQQSIIHGNRRYIDVIAADPFEFMADENHIDLGIEQHFMVMPPEQQYAVMRKGSLTIVRDPTEEMIMRINAVVTAYSLLPPELGFSFVRSSVGSSCWVRVHYGEKRLLFTGRSGEGAFVILSYRGYIG